jgi:hypothetical protein
MAKVTLKGATAQASAAARPGHSAPARFPSRMSRRQVAASARALSTSALSGKLA